MAGEQEEVLEEQHEEKQNEVSRRKCRWENPSSSCCGARSHLPGDSTITPGPGSSETDPPERGIHGTSLKGLRQRDLGSSARQVPASGLAND